MAELCVEASPQSLSDLLGSAYPGIALPFAGVQLGCYSLEYFVIAASDSYRFPRIDTPGRVVPLL